MNLKEIKRRYSKGENITMLLQQDKGVNSQKAIEIAYELQAGSYSRFAVENADILGLYAKEMADICNVYLRDKSVVLDIGTGELTTFSTLLEFLTCEVNAFAFDISLSRILAGHEFVKTYHPDLKIKTFSAKIEAIPLASNSIDLVVSSHALEPNYTREKQLLAEVFRVSRDKAILFEPDYERNSDEGKKRMEELGYIRGLDRHIEELGGCVLKKINIENIANKLNPTTAWVIDCSKVGLRGGANEINDGFICPVTNEPLIEREGCLWSSSGLYAFPIIEGVPVLKEESAIILVDFLNK